MDKILDILQFLRKRLHFIDGLIVVLVFSEIVYCAACRAVGKHIVLLLRAVSCPEALEYCRAVYVLGFLLVPSAAWASWRRIRAVPRCRKNELGIFFAPNLSPATQEVMDRLFVHLKQEIKSKEFGIRFGLKRLPPNLTIDSSEEAASVLRDAKAVVAVWGPVEQQETEEGRTTGFSKLSVTFVHRPSVIHPQRLEAMAMSLVDRKLHVRERTQIADQPLVAKDIGIIVRNLLGVSLLIDRRYGDAVNILGPLHMDLQGMFPMKRSVPVQRFCLQVQFDFAYALTMATSEEYWKWFVRKDLYGIPQATLAVWLKSVNQAAKLDPQNSVHPLSKAIYLFLSGDTQGAISAEKKGDKLAPRASATANLGLAFLYNVSGNFRLSRYQYRLGLAKKTSFEEELINECLAFISQSIKRFPEKKQLYLALGLLEYHRGSIDRARRALQSLLDDPPRDPHLQAFAIEARRLLEATEIQEGRGGDA